MPKSDSQSEFSLSRKHPNIWSFLLKTTVYEHKFVKMFFDNFNFCDTLFSKIMTKIFDKLLFFDFFRVCWFWSNASRFKKLASFIKNFARIYYTLLCFSMLHKCSHANGQTRKNVIETFLIVTHQKTNSSHHLTWTSEPWGGSGAKFFTTINTET